MRLQGKLRGCSPGQKAYPMTRLKKLWATLPAREQKKWRGLFASDVTQREIRKRIAARYEIEFHRDTQITEFRQWLMREDARALEPSQMALAACLKEAERFPEVREAFIHAFGLLELARRKSHPI